MIRDFKMDERYFDRYANWQKLMKDYNSKFIYDSNAKNNYALDNSQKIIVTTKES